MHELTLYKAGTVTTLLQMGMVGPRAPAGQQHSWDSKPDSLALEPEHKHGTNCLSTGGKGDEEKVS